MSLGGNEGVLFVSLEGKEGVVLLGFFLFVCLFFVFFLPCL